MKKYKCPNLKVQRWLYSGCPVTSGYFRTDEAAARLSVPLTSIQHHDAELVLREACVLSPGLSPSSLRVKVLAPAFKFQVNSLYTEDRKEGRKPEEGKGEERKTPED